MRSLRAGIAGGGGGGVGGRKSEVADKTGKGGCAIFGDDGGGGSDGVGEDGDEDGICDGKLGASGGEVWEKVGDESDTMVETPRGGLQNDTLTARLRARAE
jgi:hypothetical protein